mmetsp:Transcript_96828/g.269278  ORF Transcript_96828/g.269278 Transcript_96828/m.269278 type:complete len:88 (-) Transcript_96828:2279-2542(-)
MKKHGKMQSVLLMIKSEYGHTGSISGQRIHRPSIAGVSLQMEYGSLGSTFRVMSHGSQYEKNGSVTYRVARRNGNTRWNTCLDVASI